MTDPTPTAEERASDVAGSYHHGDNVSRLAEMVADQIHAAEAAARQAAFAEAVEIVQRYGGPAFSRQGIAMSRGIARAIERHAKGKP